MAFSPTERQDEAMAEINMTPFVDVMLVLLIIFIVTIPTINHAVRIDLPRAASQPQQEPAPSIDVSIDGAGRIHWNTEQVNEPALRQKLASAAQQDPMPELHLRADRRTPYEQVARVMAATQQAGIRRIGFVTDPD